MSLAWTVGLGLNCYVEALLSMGFNVTKTDGLI